ncbi:hypothetical protein HYE82_32000 [Streptomyces sp. BR123]|uniref:hypothetical protein n=1 Tax=Streptomyces sp. BR123 TaxID=2749828 RepID=UPI0015C42722|nr:hypothetical protein [Streptomyces sp. BR123]NXY98924.1 hypothetical protein [Streptomyces sp. BR123]
MGKKTEAAFVTLPASARLVAPVMAAVGGSGRSTVAYLLATAMAPLADTVVADLSPRLGSPWPSWTADAQAGGGLAALPADRPLSRADIRGAAAAVAVRQAAPALAAAAAADSHWSVLTDAREWHAAPLELPADPAAWYQLAAAGGWQLLLADTTHPVAHDILTARCSGLPGLTRTWCALPFTVPVLCAQPTAAGIRALQQAVMVLHAEGLPLQRTVVVFSAASEGRLPAVARAAATMLSARAAAVVHLPHDADIRAHGLAATQPPSRIRDRTQQAARELASAVLTAAHEAFGEPLPAAPQPAASPIPVPVV